MAISGQNLKLYFSIHIFELESLNPLVLRTKQNSHLEPK